MKRIWNLPWVTKKTFHKALKVREQAYKFQMAALEKEHECRLRMAKERMRDQADGYQQLIDSFEAYSAKVERNPHDPLIYTIRVALSAEMMHYAMGSGSTGTKEQTENVIDMVCQDITYRVKDQLVALARFSRVPR